MTSARPVAPGRVTEAVLGRVAALGRGAEPGRGVADGLILNLGGIVYVVISYTKYAFNFILVWISLICGYSFYDDVVFYAYDVWIVFGVSRLGVGETMIL